MLTPVAVPIGDEALLVPSLPLRAGQLLNKLSLHLGSEGASGWTDNNYITVEVYACSQLPGDRTQARACQPILAATRVYPTAYALSKIDPVTGDAMVAAVWHLDLPLPVIPNSGNQFLAIYMLHADSINFAGFLSITVLPAPV